MRALALQRLATPRRRHQLAMLRVRARLPTSGARLLPDFLVIGAQRCGTSSLYKYLGQHPRVAPSLRKEIEYFSRWYGDEAWYRAHFPLRLRRSASRRVGLDLLTFEATPDYLFHPLAPVRAAALVPDARLIVLLRDPVERAVSHYRHMVRLGFETLSFEAAMEREGERLAGEHEQILADPSYDARSQRLYSYLARGRYGEQIERWFQFFPRERFLILKSQDLYDDPPALFRRVLDFLDLEPWRPRTFHNYSRRGAPDEPAKIEVSAQTRARLAARFRDDGARLHQLIGWSCSGRGSMG